MRLTRVFRSSKLQRHNKTDVPYPDSDTSSQSVPGGRSACDDHSLSPFPTIRHSFSPSEQLSAMENGVTKNGSNRRSSNSHSQDSVSDDRLSPSPHGISQSSSAAMLSELRGTKTDMISTTTSSLGSATKKKERRFSSPTYKRKSDNFHRLFKEIPSDERLLVDHSCAMQRDILVQGRMYITQNWLCFYASIIKWETVVMIPMSKVTSITKERTAKVIPNAIRVSTRSDKYYFTTFHSREKCYLNLFRIWQNTMLDQKMTNQQLWIWIHNLYGHNLGLTASDDGFEAVDSAPESDSGLRLPRLRRVPSMASSVSVSMSGTPLSEHPDEEIGDNEELSDQDNCEAEEDDDEDIHECPAGHEHNGWNLLDIELNYSVDQLSQLLFTDNEFMQTFYRDRVGYKDLVLGEWSQEADENGYKHRTASYVVDVNVSFAPKTSRVTEKQRMGRDSKPGYYYCIDSDNLNDRSVPYSDHFFTWNRFCLTKISKLRCRLSVHTQVVYKKSMFSLIKGLIEKAAKSGVATYMKTLGHTLQEMSERVLLCESSSAEAQRTRQKKYRRVRNSSHTQSLINRQLSRESTNHKHFNTQTSNNGPETNESENGHYISSMVRVMSCLLIFLVVFNLLLFCKLWSMETSTSPYAAVDSHHVLKQGYSPYYLVDILNQQRALYEKDLDRWKEKLDSSLLTIDQLKVQISDLQLRLEELHAAKTCPLDDDFSL